MFDILCVVKLLLSWEIEEDVVVVCLLYFILKLIIILSEGKWFWILKDLKYY